MQGPAHIGVGWLLGEIAGLKARRDRRIVGLAGIAPDIDVIIYPLAYIFYLGDLDAAFAVYAALHHRYTHGVLFLLLAGAAAWRRASPECRAKVLLLAMLSVTLHVGGDVVASGQAWPIFPFAPFAEISWTVAWSIEASDWRNVGLSFAAITMPLVYARYYGYSPLECFSYRADAWPIAVTRGQFESTRRFRIVIYLTLAAISALVLLPLWLYFR